MKSPFETVRVAYGALVNQHYKEIKKIGGSTWMNGPSNPEQEQLHDQLRKKFVENSEKLLEQHGWTKDEYDIECMALD